MRNFLCTLIFLSSVFLGTTENATSTGYQKMQGPSLWNFLSNYSQLFLYDTYHALETLHQEYANSTDPINIYIPGIRNIIFVYDPKDIVDLTKSEKKGALKKGYTINFVQKYLLGDGFAALETEEKYKTLHKYMAPYFVRRNINENFNVIKNKIHQFFKESILPNPEGQVFDMQEHLKSLSMSIILKTMLNYDIKFSDAIQINEKIDSILEYISYRQLHSPFNIPDWLPTTYNKQQKENKKFIDDLCYEILDFSESNTKQDNFVKHLIENNVNRSTIKDQIVNILFGGYETTSHWMSMSFYRLAHHPEYRENIIDEIKKNPDVNSAKDFNMNRFPYLYSFLQEVLRLHSPIQIYGRDATQNIILRERFHIPKGSLVISSQYFSHRDHNSWTNPESFIPNRFHPGYKEEFPKEKDRHPRSFYPFGHGQRSCMGRFLADLEVKLLIYEYLKQTIFFLENLENTPPKTEIICTARLKDGVKMRLSKN